MQRRPLLLLLLLFPACITRAIWEPDPPGHSEHRVRLGVGVVVERETEVAQIAFAVHGANVPPQLATDLVEGRTWLWLQRPVALSIAGRDLLVGRGPLAPEYGLVQYVQVWDRERRLFQRPALLRLGGRVERERFESLAQPAAAVRAEHHAIDRMDDPAIRAALARAARRLLEVGGHLRERDSAEWVAVRRKGVLVAAPEWRAALSDPRDTAGLRAVVRRWRPGAGAAWFEVPFEMLVLFAQMTATADGERYDWVWEGIWSARMAPPAHSTPGERHRPPERFVIRYRELTELPPYTRRGIVHRLLLTPTALSADFIAAALADDGD